jgi:hypothetical protein
MKVSEVHWVADRLGQAALDLRLDGRQAHIKTSQRSALLERGILDGISYLRSERSDPNRNAYIQGSYGPSIHNDELVGCTDNPEVFGLFTEMCRAIRDGTWVAGPREVTAGGQR